MTDFSKDEKTPCQPEMAAVVELQRLLLIVVGLKKQALTRNDKELYHSLNHLEQDLNSLCAREVILDRWGLR